MHNKYARLSCQPQYQQYEHGSSDESICLTKTQTMQFCSVCCLWEDILSNVIKLMLVIVILSAISLFADTVELKSGTMLEGTITGFDKAVIYFKMDQSKYLLIDRPLIKSMSSEKHATATLYSSKVTYPRDYHKYLRHADLEEYLKQADRIADIPNPEPQVTEYTTFGESYSKGIYDAKTMYSSQRWFMGGIASGLFLPILGATMITLAAPETSPNAIPQNCEPMGYLEGFKKQTKLSNRGSALSGGVIGTAATIATVLLIFAKK